MVCRKTRAGNQINKFLMKNPSTQAGGASLDPTPRARGTIRRWDQGFPGRQQSPCQGAREGQAPAGPCTRAVHDQAVKSCRRKHFVPVPLNGLRWARRCRRCNLGQDGGCWARGLCPESEHPRQRTRQRKTCSAQARSAPRPFPRESGGYWGWDQICKVRGGRSRRRWRKAQAVVRAPGTKGVAAVTRRFSHAAKLTGLTRRFFVALDSSVSIIHPTRRSFAPFQEDVVKSGRGPSVPRQREHRPPSGWMPYRGRCGVLATIARGRERKLVRLSPFSREPARGVVRSQSGEVLS